MKNLIVNIFKTLFFFDLAVIVIYLLPEITGGSAAMLKLKQEAVIAGVPLFLTLIYYFIIEKRKTGAPFNRHIFKAFFKGLAAGVIPLGIAVGLLVLFKELSFTGISKPERLWLWLGAILCNAIANELLLRGYLFNLYKKHYGFMFSAIVTTMLFASLDIELFNKPKLYIANILLLNFLLCLILEYTGSVIATVTARFMYTGISCLLFGSLPLSGGYPTVFETAVKGKALITGGEYGFEGSIITFAVLAFITLWLLTRKYKLISLTKEKIGDFTWLLKRKLSGKRKKAKV